MLAASLLAAASFWLQAHIGLNLVDEGYWWHGTMRVLSGEVPLRDFQSYDPSRYYWSAFWLRLAGSDGILALRASAALFQVIGLTLAFLLLRRVLARPLAIMIAVLALALWFFPRHKSFDISLSIAAVYFGTLLLERPLVRRYLLAGAYVGVAAGFGKQHALYGVLALGILGLIAWARLDRTRGPEKLAAFAAGGLAGYAPVLFLELLYPGFLEALIETVRGLIRVGTTNITLPVPWPWVVDYAVPWPRAVHLFMIGIAFIMLPLAYLAGGILLATARRMSPVFTASVVVGAVYMHYAFARADAGHVAHAIAPFVFAVLALPWRPPVLLAAVFGYSALAAGPANPLYIKAATGHHFSVDVRGDTLLLDPWTLRAVRAVQAVRERMGPGDEIVFAPYWSTMYGVLGIKAPVWETYSSWTNDLQGQRRFVAELEQRRVAWAVVGNAPLDGREDMRYSRTHPIAWRYFSERYEPVPFDALPPDYRLLRRREG